MIGRFKMQGMNFDRIGDDLAQAYEDGYQKGLKENKILAEFWKGELG